MTQADENTKRWVWPLLPFRFAKQKNQRYSGNDAVPGRSVTIEKRTFVDVPNFRNYGPFGREPDRRVLISPHEFYVPAPDDVAILRKKYPKADPWDPSWLRIETDLLARGLEPNELGRLKAPAILQLLSGKMRSGGSKRRSQSGTAKRDESRGNGCWLTVTECAVLLADELNIDKERAKGRISKAATAGDLKSNGRGRTARRIDLDSFRGWSLVQRNRSLDSDNK